MSEDSNDNEKILGFEDALRTCIAEAVDNGVELVDVSGALAAASEDILKLKVQDANGEPMTADEAVSMMIKQSLELALEKFIDGLADDAALIALAELILEEGHNYSFPKEVKNNAAVVSNLRKALGAL